MDVNYKKYGQQKVDNNKNKEFNNFKYLFFINSYLAIANLNAQWRQLQEIWARKQYDSSIIDGVVDSDKKKKKTTTKKPKKDTLYARRPDGQFVSLSCPCCNKYVSRAIFF